MFLIFTDEVRDVSYKKPSIEVEVTSTKKKRGRKAKATKVTFNLILYK